MTRRPTNKLLGLVGLSGGMLFVGLLFGRADVLVVAIPAALAIAYGVAATTDPDVAIELDVTPRKCLEDEFIEAAITLDAEQWRGEVDLTLGLPPALEAEEGSRRVVLLTPGQRQTVTFRLRVSRWGAHRVGLVGIRCLGPGRMLAFERTIDFALLVKTYPQLDTIRKAVRPPRTQVFTGNYVARVEGSGIEFSKVRPFAAGDSVRRVNWRVSSRSNELNVNVFHPERNADVVLLIDSFEEIGLPGHSSLDITVRVAAELARHYLAHRDRVGIVNFGGALKWLTSSMGRSQFFRIADYLLETQATPSYVWRDIVHVPRRTLPPLSMLIGLSPLTNNDTIAAFTNLRARGFPIMILDTMPHAWIDPLPTRQGELAFRTWTLQRGATSATLSDRGIPVVPLGRERSLQGALAALSRWERTSVGAR